MTLRELLIGVALAAFILAALALAFAIRAVMLRAQAGRRRVWGGLWLRSALIAALTAQGALFLATAPPPDPVNQPAPASVGAMVAFVQTARDGAARTVVGVSARDGATRWTRPLDDEATELLTPTPGLILAPTASKGFYALRASDGAVLWRAGVGALLSPERVAADSARVYALAQALPPRETGRGTGAVDVVAFDLQTGAQVWREPLPTEIVMARRLTLGDGQVFVAGDVDEQGAPLARWGVVALRSSDGMRRWSGLGKIRSGPDDPMVMALLVAGGNLIVVPQTGQATALRGRDGSVAWSGSSDLTPDNPPEFFTATADGDTVYAVEQPIRGATAPDGNPIAPPVSLVALNANNGEVRWQTAVSFASSTWSSLTVSDGVLLSGARVTGAMAYGGYNPSSGWLTAYGAASGRALWRVNFPDTGVSWNMSPQIGPWSGEGAAVYLMGVQSDPYIQDYFSCLFFCPGVSWLYAVNVHTGAPWWRVRIGAANLTHFVF